MILIMLNLEMRGELQFAQCPIFIDHWDEVRLNLFIIQSVKSYSVAMFVGGVVTPMIGMAALAYFDGCDPV